MFEVLSNDYICIVKVKGLSRGVIIVKYVMWNVMFLVVFYMGFLVVGILMGSFVIEKIFGILGLGLYFVFSILNWDYIMIMGVMVFYSILLFFCILFVDIVYGFIDFWIKFIGVKKGE